jgi:hypothetical protein
MLVQLSSESMVAFCLHWIRAPARRQSESHEETQQKYPRRRMPKKEYRQCQQCTEHEECREGRITEKVERRKDATHLSIRNALRSPHGASASII